MAEPAYNGDFDLTGPWERAIDNARHGKVVWLSEHRQRKFALLPAEVAQAALEALEDAEDLADIKARHDEPTVTWDEAEKELDALDERGR